MAIVDGAGLPLSLIVAGANRSEFKLATPTVTAIKVLGAFKKRLPKIMVGDKGYDSKTFRQFLKGQGIHPCIPHRWHKELKSKVDKKEYQGRWHVERTFAWIGNFRHLILRYERKVAIFSGFLYLAAALICIRSLVSG